MKRSLLDCQDTLCLGTGCACCLGHMVSVQVGQVFCICYICIYIYTYMCAYPSLKPMVNLQSSDTNMSRNYFTASYCVILILCHTHTIISESKCLN